MKEEKNAMADVFRTHISSKRSLNICKFKLQELGPLTALLVPIINLLIEIFNFLITEKIYITIPCLVRMSN